MVDGLFVCVTLTRKAPFGSILKAIDKAPAMAGMLLLIDVRTSRLADPTIHALLGAELARKFARARRVALVVDEDVISYNAERAAHGLLDLRVITDKSEATSWLSRA